MKTFDEYWEKEFPRLSSVVQKSMTAPVKEEFRLCWNSATNVERQRQAESRKPESHADFVMLFNGICNADRQEPHGKISPNDLEILIHYHCNPAVHPRYDAPGVVEATERFLELGIVYKRIDKAYRYRLTDKGKAWLHCILSTPFPKKVWLDDNGRIIDEKFV